EPREPGDGREADHPRPDETDARIGEVLVHARELLSALQKRARLRCPIDVVVDDADVRAVRGEPLEKTVMDDRVAADPIRLLRREDLHAPIRERAVRRHVSSRLRVRPRRSGRSRLATTTTPSATRPKKQSGGLIGVERYSTVTKGAPAG